MENETKFILAYKLRINTENIQKKLNEHTKGGGCLINLQTRTKYAKKSNIFADSCFLFNSRLIIFTLMIKKRTRYHQIEAPYFLNIFSHPFVYIFFYSKAFLLAHTTPQIHSTRSI